MKRRTVGAALALVALAGCVKAPQPPPQSVHTVAVFPPSNRTSDELLISGGTVLEKYVFHTTRVTVPDVLAAEARTLLERQGYTLVSPELIEAATSGHAPISATEAAALAREHDLPGDVLYIDLRQWEPNLTYGPSAIIVALHIELVDPATGRTLWSADHPPRPVATPATINFADAYWVAARSVIAQMLAPFAARRADR
jgi:hypothetical protein